MTDPLMLLSELLQTPARVRSLALTPPDQARHAAFAGLEFARRKSRLTHPSGRFDNAKRWHPDPCLACCKGIREPSREFPFSLMVHARTAEHVAREFGMPHHEVVKSIGSALKAAGLDGKLPTEVTEAALAATITEGVKRAGKKLIQTRPPAWADSPEYAPAKAVHTAQAMCAIIEAMPGAAASATPPQRRRLREQI